MNERRIGVIHEATKVVLRPLQKCELKGSAVKSRDVVEWKCVPLPLSYCCDIAEAEDISAVRQGFAVKRRCVRCKVIGEDFISGAISGERSLKDTKVARGRFLRMSKNNIGSVDDGNAVAQEEEEERVQLLLRKTFLLTWLSLLEIFMESQRV